VCTNVELNAWLKYHSVFCLRVMAKKAFSKAADKVGIKSSGASSHKPKFLVSGGLTAGSLSSHAAPPSSAMLWRNSIVSTDNESDYGGSDTFANARLSRPTSSIYDEGQEDSWSSKLCILPLL